MNQFLDIHSNPSAFLNGSAPLQVSGYSHHCNLQGQNCTDEPSPDSFEWYDALHPSEQTERVIAQNFVDVLDGSSQYVTYYESN